MSFIERFARIIHHIRLSLYSLSKNRSDSKVTSIAHYLKRQVLVRGSHNGCCSQICFKLLELLLEFYMPLKLCIFFKEIVERLNNFREVSDEPESEAYMSQELPHCLHISRRWKFRDQFYLGFIHFNSPLGNDVPQHYALIDHKMAFFPV